MIDVDTSKRLNLEQILRHPWVIADQGSMELELPMSQVVQTSVIPAEEGIDPDVLTTMNSLQCFKDKEKLRNELLTSKHNTEKVVYFLLLDRKVRNPSCEDDEEIRAKSDSTDPPRKRIDSVRLNGQPRLSLGNLSEGSPVAARRALAVQQLRPSASLTGSSPVAARRPLPAQHVRKSSLKEQVSPVVSPASSPRAVGRTASKTSAVGADSPYSTPPGSPSLQSAPWRTRLHTIKNSFLGSPRFHRRKLQVPTSEEIPCTPETSPELTKKSWFGALMGTEREEHHYVMIKDKVLSQIKADLVHAFLCTPDLSHSVVSPTSFRAEYRRSGSTSMFSRNIKFQVDISPANADHGAAGDSTKMHCLTFTLLSGPSRRFKRVSELIQSLLQSSTRGQSSSVSAASGRRISAEMASDSSSSSYSSMDRVSPTPPTDDLRPCTNGHERKSQRTPQPSGHLMVNGRKPSADSMPDTKV